VTRWTWRFRRSLSLRKHPRHSKPKIKNAWDGVTDIGFKVSDGFKEGAKALSDAQKQIHDRLVGIGQELASAFSGGGGFVQGLKNLGTSVAKDFTAGLLSFIPGIGPLLSQLAGPLIDGIKHLFGGVFSTAGRDAVKQFADSMGGFDALHKTLLDSLQGVGEQFWVRLTQEVGRGDAKGAQAVIDEIHDALANAPLTGAQLAAQAGYQTQADLKAVADKAEEVYDYMVSSGQYSASQIADAFKKMQDAQLAAMDDTKRAAYDAATTARDAAQQVIDALDGQIKSLQHVDCAGSARGSHGRRRGSSSAPSSPRCKNSTPRRRPTSTTRTTRSRRCLRRRRRRGRRGRHESRRADRHRNPGSAG
jgi:BMFP domain-containing protein YqiC